MIIMKVSIIIPIYNVRQYLVRCLDSVCAQTFPPIECLLIDDCSSDNSIDIAELYLQKYCGNIHFRIIRHKENQGQGVARNTGIHAATGEYIFFLDSDDALMPDCIETLVKLAEKHPDADYVQGNTVKGSGCLATHRFQREIPEYCNNPEELERITLFDTVTTVWNRLVKRSFITNNSLYFPDGIANSEDQYWLYFMSKRVKAAAFTNKGTYFYYVNANSSMTSHSKQYIKKRADWHLLTAQAICDDISKSYSPISRNARRFLANFLCTCMMQLCLSRSLKLWIKYWKLIGSICKNKILCTRYGYALCFASLPPFCFFAKYSAWRWRMRHYVVNKI